MKKAHVEIGKIYTAKVSDKLARVQITSESPYGGWDGINIDTNRKVRIQSAQRLRMEILKPEPAARRTEKGAPGVVPEAQQAIGPESGAVEAEAAEAMPATEGDAEACEARGARPESKEGQAPEDAEPSDPMPAAREGMATDATEATSAMPEADEREATETAHASDPPPTDVATDALPPSEIAADALPAASAADPPPEATPAGPGVKLSKLSVPELQALYEEVVGRPTSSSHVGYLRWKVSQARKGRIPVGARGSRRAEGEAADFKVLPLRMEAELVTQLDEARERLGLKTRMDLFRRALHAFLLEAGEVRVAEMFAPETHTNNND